MKKKIRHAKELIQESIKAYPRIAVACSFGKDSIVTVDLAQQVKEDIPVFSVMTKYKPKATFSYLVNMEQKMNIPLKVYYVGNTIPREFQGNGMEIQLLSPTEFNKRESEIENETGKKLYEIDPDECCRMLKVNPTQEAVKNLDCWICGLRNTEGRTRKNFKEIENRGGLIKVNPILEWTEADVWRYMAIRKLDVHPWYSKGYRSLGCAPCSNPGGNSERAGRWKGTSKCGGECGIHTKTLQSNN